MIFFGLCVKFTCDLFGGIAQRKLDEIHRAAAAHAQKSPTRTPDSPKATTPPGMVRVIGVGPLPTGRCESDSVLCFLFHFFLEGFSFIYIYFG